MKFYIASYVGEKERVRAIQRQLRALGHEITVDWTSYPGVFGKERDEHPERVGEIAVRDMRGVQDCDVFILLAEPADGRAKYAELGAAIMANLYTGRPRVYVLGNKTSQSVFFYHPTVRRVTTLEAVLEELGA